MTNCPICAQLNGCTASTDCWCMTMPITQEALSDVPEEAKGEVCICQACAEKYAKKEPTE